MRRHYDIVLPKPLERKIYGSNSLHFSAKITQQNVKFREYRPAAPKIITFFTWKRNSRVSKVPTCLSRRFRIPGGTEINNLGRFRVTLSKLITGKSKDKSEKQRLNALSIQSRNGHAHLYARHAEATDQTYPKANPDAKTKVGTPVLSGDNTCYSKHDHYSPNYHLWVGQPSQSSRSVHHDYNRNGD